MVNFRIKHLDKMQAIMLSREIEGACYEATDDPRFCVGLIPLNAMNFDEITLYFVRQNLELDNCDLLVEVDSSAVTEINLPTIVNQFLKHIDCQISLKVR
ncbi:hypothetical protein [Saccharobesus litoralis]|uniref:hypothetical protein n=1 Tax=Saccharobesus litoralis TaxID=2172099 RepID=UPI00131EED5A|nr:hypothetical protein [Saccharobesus litoralis]